MRQLKFRIWDNKYKKLHYKVCIGNVCDEANYTAHSVYLRPGDTDYHIDEPGLWMHFNEHSDIIISQFTGLKDINGVDIYEGDILKGITSNMSAFDKESNYQVMWGVDSWHIKGTYYSLQELFNHCDISLEIIGNIYENQYL